MEFMPRNLRIQCTCFGDVRAFLTVNETVEVLNRRETVCPFIYFLYACALGTHSSMDKALYAFCQSTSTFLKAMKQKFIIYYDFDLIDTRDYNMFIN